MDSRKTQEYFIGWAQDDELIESICRDLDSACISFRRGDGTTFEDLQARFASILARHLERGRLPVSLQTEMRRLTCERVIGMGASLRLDADQVLNAFRTNLDVLRRNPGNLVTLTGVVAHYLNDCGRLSEIADFLRETREYVDTASAALRETKLILDRLSDSTGRT